jgi:flagellar biogenesis protein FliO
MATPDPEGISFARLIFATGTVGGLLALLAFVLKGFAARGVGFSLSKGKRRIRVLETLPIDTRRRLVLIRCDETEHLLLLGGAQDCVVKSALALPSLNAPDQDK